MRRFVSRTVCGVRGVNVCRSLVATGIALFIARSSWAQSMPASDNTAGAESQASMQVPPESAPATTDSFASASSLPFAPALDNGQVQRSSANNKATAAASNESSLQAHLYLLLAGGLCSCAGLAISAAGLGSLPAVLYGSLFPGGTYGLLVLFASAVLGPIVALLAPVALGVGGLLDSLGHDRAWWPPAAGAIAGWIAEVGVIGAAYLVVSAMSPTIQFPGRIGVVAIVVAAWSAFSSPVALGGALLADMLFQPEHNEPASAPATAGEE